MARGTCWVGYEQKGMKKKGDKLLPNCVKVAKKGDSIKKKIADKKLNQMEPREELDVGGRKQDTYDEYFSDSLDVNVTPEPDIIFNMPVIRKGDDLVPSDIRAMEIKKGGLIKGKPKLALRGWK